MAASRSAKAAVSSAATESAAQPEPGRTASDRWFAVFFLTGVFALYAVIGYALYLLITFTSV